MWLYRQFFVRNWGTVMRVSVVLLLVAFPALATDRDEKEKTELKKLEGTWIHVSTQRNGVTKQEPLTYWIFEGNRAKIYVLQGSSRTNPKIGPYKPDPINHWLTYHFKLDSSKSPKALDQSTQYKTEKSSGPARLAIYKLDGDTLTICYAGYYDKGKRPDDFTAAKDSDRAIYILKREKK